MKLTSKKLQKLILEELGIYLSESEKISRRNFLKMAGGAAVAATLPKGAKASNLGSHVKASGGIELQPDSSWQMTINQGTLESAFGKYEVVAGFVDNEPATSPTLVILGGSYQDKSKYSSAALKEYDSFWNDKREQINSGAGPVEINHPKANEAVGVFFQHGGTKAKINSFASTALTAYKSGVSLSQQKNFYQSSTQPNQLLYFYRVKKEGIEADRKPKRITIIGYKTEADFESNKGTDITSGIVSVQ